MNIERELDHLDREGKEIEEDLALLYSAIEEDLAEIKALEHQLKSNEVQAAKLEKRLKTINAEYKRLEKQL